MGINLSGLIGGGLTAARGAQEGIAAQRALERKIMQEKLAQKLLEAQITKLNTPQVGPGQYFTDDEGNVTYSTAGGPGVTVQGVRGQTRREPAPERPIPLAPGGVLVDPRTGKVVAQGNPKANPKQSPGIIQKVAGNRQQIGVIDEALKALSERPAGIGLKGYLPDALLQRVDPQGVPLRSAISDIGSLKIHDRSGAAVTDAEMRRLKFIPTEKDTPEAARTKLQRLRDFLVTETDFLSQTPAQDEAGNEAIPDVPVTPQFKGPSDRARGALSRVRGR